jgi:hypothetical protein
MAAAMALPLTETVHAETAPERGLIGLKYLDYLDSQPGNDRIRVKSPAVIALVPISSDWSVGGTLTSDVISGASPAYHTTALRNMHDRRRAGDADVTRYFPNGTLTFGAYLSSEADYLSRGLSVQGTVSSEDKNTTWAMGLGVNRDVINPVNHIVDHETKRVANMLLGLTQVLTTRDIVQLNLSQSLGRGYYSDPYKVYDERPRDRNITTMLARWNHYVEAFEGTARFSYRYYSDSWSIKAHTMGVEYVQPLPNGWAVTPSMRLYTQSAASFYVDADASRFPFPPNPPAGAVNYSEDQRVSAFGARTFGLKVAKQIDADWLVDVKVERYAQHAAWRMFGSGSPGLAPFYARMIQVGLSRQF